RFGIIAPPKPAGDVWFTMPEGAGWQAERLHFRGHHVHGARVVLDYRVDDVEVLESPWSEQTPTGPVVTRSFDVAPTSRPLVCRLLDMPLNGQPSPPRVELMGGDPSWLETQDADQRRRVVLRIPAATRRQSFQVRYLPATTRGAAGPSPSPSTSSVQELVRPGAARWTEKIETQGHKSADDAPYVLDTFTLPFDNPYRALMFTSGHDFLSNGDLVVCTVHGDVWRVHRGAEPAAPTARSAAASFPLRWQRIATGLHQPLGLLVKRAADGDQVFVLGRDQITRLRDQNGDGETDFYECFSNQYPTSAGGHDYITCLEQDSQGRFVFLHANLGVVRVATDGRSFDVLSTGLRNPNGLGLGPDDVITAAPQEGEWTPASAIYVARPGAHFGGGGPRVTPERPLGFDPPLVWIPRRVDNSSGGQTWVTSRQWGPLTGQLLHLSFGQCSLMLVGGEPQGGPWAQRRSAFLVEFPGRFESGAMRGRFSPFDGQLYVTGLRGWTSAATRDGCLQRVRYTGQPVDLPLATQPYRNGLAITFSDPLDREAAEQPGNYHVERWNYRYSAAYGSPEFRVSDPQQEGRDEVRVRSATLLDERTVFLEMADMRPVHEMAISCSLQSAAGTDPRSAPRPIRRTLYQSIHALGDQQVDEARLTRRADAGALDESVAAGLRPGLLARFAPHSGETEQTSQTGSNAAATGAAGGDQRAPSFVDCRVDRMAALRVRPETSPTPFLPPGRFRLRWEGYLRVPLPLSASFSLQGTGAAALSINDVVVRSLQPLTAATPTAAAPVMLRGGFNKIVVDYVSPAEGDATVQLAWESPEFAREPVPPTQWFCAGDDPQLLSSETLRRGRELFATLKCAACHPVPSSPPWSAELLSDAPQLTGAARLHPDWLTDWIASPGKSQPECRMPRLGATSDEARELASWVKKWMNETPAAAPTGDVRAGSLAFEQLGCLACHRLTTEGQDPWRRRSLTQVNAKFPDGELARWLREPGRYHPTTRMPDFRLDAATSSALEAYLRSQSAPREALEKETPASDRGEKLAAEFRCTVCHAAGPQTPQPLAAPVPLVDLASPRGCLAPADHQRRAVPWYDLAPADRVAVARFVASGYDSLGRAAPSEMARSLLQTLRCAACHDRDGQRSPRGRIVVEEGERGLVPEPLPNLTWTGDKLHAQWTQAFLAGQYRDQPLRPWLQARMPVFPAFAAVLAEGFAAEHGVDPTPRSPVPVDEHLVQLGHQLTQRTALDCRQCHAVGDQPAQGDDQTKIAPGINFALVRQRVRYDYYQRFTLDPPRFDISTKMPKLAPDGKKTKVEGILEGDARRQFDAIWQFLQYGVQP
ncbi:MAG: PA14 domain-containing protein, partial [Pirellulales bacterium]